ncbi:MAG: APC family permease [Acidobacteria bacterium]|nr:APC family permease [Acidobacteriota bacterium]
MVAGGPYGLEDVVQKAGYAGTLLILLLTPLLWSLPTALMVSELASALPEEGGFYAWVRRAMGRFWGFQEAWLTLVGSIFDMALYPTLFVWYLGHFAPALTRGHRATLLGLGMIAVCTLWNIAGARAVGGGSLLMTIVLLGPFVVLMGYALLHRSSSGAAHTPLGHVDILGGILIAMWNYMGWDNVSTIAGEVDRPQRTYPLAMLGAVALVVLSYILPIAAVARTGIDPNSWSTGGWVDVARIVSGEGLAIAVTLGGVIGAIGSFNALMLSLSRLPLVMTEDGFLPKIFARRHPKTGAPWVAIVVCAVGWAAALTLGFERLVILDVLLTGLSILLEFWALVALRIREPELPRPYRVPGGLFGAVAIGIAPLALMAAAVVRNHDEQIGSISALTIGLVLIAAGPAVYFLSRAFDRRRMAG